MRLSLVSKWKTVLLAAAVTALVSAQAFAGPRLVVTGVTSYDPAKAWNGFTILSGSGSARLVDMNGNLVHEWDLKGGIAQPPKLYPGGNLLATIYPPYNQAGQGQNTVAILDFDGKIIRQFNKMYQVKKPSKGMPVEADGTAWISRQHHDYQLEGDSVGYYGPYNKAKLDGKMLILMHRTVKDPKITDKLQLQDDRIVILDKDNKVIFDWAASDHVAEFKNLLTDPGAKKLLNEAHSEVNAKPTDHEYNGFDWFHINCASWLGPNKWYDQDPKKYAAFHPDNIIADSRETSYMFIIDHKTGKIVWQAGPPFTGEDADIGPVYGVHHTHMIPKGLPGEGNIMIFDNGGTTSYHKQLPPRYYSRVLEFNPVTKKKVWEYSAENNQKAPKVWQLMGDNFFFSAFISDAQRLPNGNTMICEGSKNRVFEVTPAGEIVWEYVNPYNQEEFMPITYRAYRVPYDYVPQLPKGKEVPVTMPKSAQIQIPNDQGEMASVVPTVDKVRAARMTPLAPVKLPRLKDGGTSAAVAPAPAATPAPEEAEEPAMKAY